MVMVYSLISRLLTRDSRLRRFIPPASEALRLIFWDELPFRIAKGYMNEGMKFFADGGTAFPMDGSLKNKAIYLFKAGGGYRIPIYGRFGMDLSLAAQYTVDHPVEIIDKYTHRYLDLENVRRSDRDYFALSLTLALYF